MSHEQRGSARRAFRIPCSWTREAELTDLSATGCYVESRLVPKIGQHVEFTAELAGISIAMRGTAVNARPGLGFGVQFAELSDEAKAAIHVALATAARGA